MMMDASVNELRLSVRAMNCLINANLTTVGSVIKATDAELLRIDNLGRSTVREIRHAIEFFCITTADTPVDRDFIDWCYRNRDLIELLRGKVP